MWGGRVVRLEYFWSANVDRRLMRSDQTSIAQNRIIFYFFSKIGANKFIDYELRYECFVDEIDIFMRLVMVGKVCAAISLCSNRRIFIHWFRNGMCEGVCADYDKACYYLLRNQFYLNRTRLMPIHHEKFVILVWSSHKLWISNKRRQIVFRFTTWDYRPSQWLRINTIIIQTFASVAIRREMCMLHGGSFILLFFLVFFAAMSNGERVQKRQVTHVTLDAN